MAEDPSTWAELKTSLRDWLDKDTGGISDDRLEECIAFAERHFQRNVFTPDREAALAITADAQSEALPSDFWGFKSGPYVDAATDVVLVRLEPGDLRRTYPTGTTGTPAHYAIEGENILFGPVPSSSVTVKGTYWQTIPALNSGQTTNWLLTDHPDLYLAGSLHYAYLFLRDNEGAAYWRAERDVLIREISKAARRREVNSGPLIATHSVGHVRNIQA